MCKARREEGQRRATHTSAAVHAGTCSSGCCRCGGGNEAAAGPGGTLGRSQVPLKPEGHVGVPPPLVVLGGGGGGGGGFTTSGSAWSSAPSTLSTTSCSDPASPRKPPTRSARGWPPTPASTRTAAFWALVIMTSTSSWQRCKAWSWRPFGGTNAGRWSGWRWDRSWVSSSTSPLMSRWVSWRCRSAVSTGWPYGSSAAPTTTSTPNSGRPSPSAARPSSGLSCGISSPKGSARFSSLCRVPWRRLALG
ncbi:josephin-2 isoform X1 [Accipiter gentilis]|uniref:josephin-2 isoform X1 n=1 Tax=Astur gentilis TaxID=8957 RepID=UPI002110114D|nr:josephin-2 isoform X1 [Accipiter gentilis]